jgi:transcription-repair coupling factor (superfamily II helicase)
MWDPLLGAPSFQELARRLAQGDAGLRLSGLVPGARALAISLLVARVGRPVLLVVPDDSSLDGFRRDLSALAGLTGGSATRIVMMPALDADPYAAISAHPEILRERVLAIDRLGRGEVDVLLVPVRALLQWLPSPDEWSSWSRAIRPGAALPPDRFVLQALELGYRRVETVSAPGEISRRGGIVDIFPPTEQEPVRIELFGDTVDSLHSFPTDNQSSTGHLDEVVVGPAVENPPTDGSGAESLPGTREPGAADGAAAHDAVRTRRATARRGGRTRTCGRGAGPRVSRDRDLPRAERGSDPARTAGALR